MVRTFATITAIIIAISHVGSACTSRLRGSDTEPPTPVTRAVLIGDWDECWLDDLGHRHFDRSGTCTWVGEGGDNWKGRWWLDKNRLIVYERSDSEVVVEWECQLNDYHDRRIRKDGSIVRQTRASGHPIVITHHSDPSRVRDTRQSLVLIRNRPES